MLHDNFAVGTLKHKLLELLLPGPSQLLLEYRIFAISAIGAVLYIGNTSLTECVLAFRTLSRPCLLVVGRLDYREANRALVVVYKVFDLR